MKGIPAAVLAGGLSGDLTRGLEVLSSLTETDVDQIREGLARNAVTVIPMESSHPLHIIIRAEAGGEYGQAEVIDTHLGLGNVEKNGRIIRRRQEQGGAAICSERGILNLKDILDYADTVDLRDVRELLEQQVKCNMAISREGLANNWGACVGKTLLKSGGKDLWRKIKAAAAAGSDARMNGCPLPVVINSGSGNQGITVSLPVVVYAEHICAGEDRLLRALCVSNLTAIHQKTGIGRLSAFCGAVSAATGAMAGIAYLDGASYDVIAQAVVNALGNVGGILCDGAKASCAAKIASAIDGALLGYELAKQGRGFQNGEGIVKADVEETIASVGQVAAVGMRETDQEILRIMIEHCGARQSSGKPI